VASAFRRKESPISLAPFLWALAYVVFFATVFYKISWSLGDTYSHMVGPATSSWRKAVAEAFGASGREYRPLFTLGIKASYDAFGTWLPFYQTFVLLLFSVLLVLVIRLCRPSGWRRSLATCIAVSCVCGLHTSRILFGFWPLNHYAFVIVCVLLAIALALHPRTRPIDWVFGPLTIIALFGLELGVLIIPVSIALWWFRAPGLSWRGVASVLTAAAVYVTIRVTFGDHPGALSLFADGGFGFQNLSADALRARFGDSPWLFWIYNVIGTLGTTMASEPREGVYAFVESLLARDMEGWQWFQVGSSVLTTLAIAGGLAWGWPWKERDRLLVVAGCSLLVFGSALGFVYTRDRIGLPGGIGYALLLYVAIASWLEKSPAAGWRRRVAAAVVTAVAAVWVVRGGEMWFQLRDTAWDYHVEWTDRFEELGGKQESTDLLKELRSEALARTPADPRLDPAWTYLVFERRFHRSSHAAVP
jgi:hypothetical protein